MCCSNNQNPGQGIPRLKFELDGLTYITDLHGRQITCWAEGLTFHEIHITSARSRYLWEHRKFLRDHASNISNHTLFIIDQSGSMKLSDVPCARNRSCAVFSAILLDFLLESMVKSQANNHDVMSIMDMRDSTRVVLDREPLDEMTYNKIIQLMYKVKPGGQGNFIPAFEAASKQLSEMFSHHRQCNVHVIFLTDGRPSDQKKNVSWQANRSNLSQSDWVLEEVKTRLRMIAQNLREKGSFTFLTFGAESSGKRSFDFLVQLSECTKMAGCQSKAIDTEKSTARLGSTLTSISSETTARSTSLAPGQSLVEKRLIAIDDTYSLKDQRNWYWYKGADERYFDVLSSSTHWLQRVTYEKVQGHQNRVEERQRFLHKDADGLAILRRPFASGVERFAFIAREVTKSNSPLECRFVGDWLVAKQSIRPRKSKGNIGFHVMYTKIQRKASSLARKFNHRLEFLQQCAGIQLPHVEIVDCFVYKWKSAGESWANSTDPHKEVQWKETDFCLIRWLAGGFIFFYFHPYLGKMSPF